MDSGQLVDLCPQHTVMVDLYWHHWELEPPLAHDVTALIVKAAHRELVSAVADESVMMIAEPSESMAGLRHTSTAMAGNTAKANCNTE